MKRPGERQAIRPAGITPASIGVRIAALTRPEALIEIEAIAVITE